MSYTDFSSFSLRYGNTSPSFSRPLTLNGSNASARTTHVLIVVPKFFALNGPRGTYSQAWMSRADQSFIKTTPKRLSAALSIDIGVPCSLDPHTNAPNSSSISSFLQGEKVGCFVSAVGLSRIWPFGRRIGVPEGTIDEARPW